MCRIITLIFLTAVILLFILKSPISIKSINDYIHKNILVGILVVSIVCIGLSILLFFLLWQLIGKVEVVINDKSLLVKKNILGISKNRKYNLTDISDVAIRHDVPSNRYWSVGSNMGRGIKVAEDKNQTMLYFNFNGKTYSIGDSLESFNADALLKEIKTRQSKLKGK